MLRESALESKTFKCLSILTILFFSIIASLNMVSLNVQAPDPHVVTGTVFETNGTLLSGANVTILNMRTGESGNATSNGTAIYAYNLLNLPSGWSFGDTIQVNTTNSTGVGGTNSTQLLIGTTSTTIDIWIGTNASLSGIYFYIIDENGMEVSDALINIKDNSGDIVTTKLSDSNGKASTTLSDGLYTITVGKSGYDNIIRRIRVHGMNPYTISLGTEAEEVALINLWYWGLIIFAIVGIIGILAYIAKKV